MSIMVKFSRPTIKFAKKKKMEKVLVNFCRTLSFKFTDISIKLPQNMYNLKYKHNLWKINKENSFILSQYILPYFYRLF